MQSFARLCLATHIFVWRIGRCGVLRIFVSRLGRWEFCASQHKFSLWQVADAESCASMSRNAGCCISDISDTERNVVVTEHMERDVIVRHIESNVDVTSSTFIPEGNERRTYFCGNNVGYSLSGKLCWLSSAFGILAKYNSEGLAWIHGLASHNE